MRKLTVTARAKSDLIDIGNFIALDSRPNANRFVQRLRKNFSLLCSHPFIGRAREKLSPGLRSISYGNYIIFYRVMNDKVIIARDIHGARDIEKIFDRP